TAGHFKGRAVVQYLETDAFSKIGSPLPMICGKIIWGLYKSTPMKCLNKLNLLESLRGDSYGKTYGCHRKADYGAGIGTAEGSCT
ncbi:MAG: hypothetical protein IJJ75_03850, partial [Firmicutes bacterium]|nr:hypothetical protein [Bacillota bacterium]